VAHFSGSSSATWFRIGVTDSQPTFLMLEIALNYLSLRIAVMLKQFRKSLLASHIHKIENSENDLPSADVVFYKSI
jgi:hypothetical protein